VLRNLLCVWRSFLPTLAHQPGLCGGSVRRKAFAGISVSPYRVGRTAKGPHGDISQPQARKTPAKRS
jgi:hypothetical protein